MKLLFSPLDWGLGHTTRSIPILQFMNELGYEILIACNSQQQLLLAEAIPSARFVELQGYDMVYGKSRVHTLLKIILQLPKMAGRIGSEKNRVRLLVAKEKPDLLLSDNRYGFFHTGLPSILIIHQLNIRTGLGKPTDGLVNFFHQKLVRRFTACWIPDAAGASALSGVLSSGAPNSQWPPIYHLGALSRFNKRNDIARSNDLLLIILSGPEPQRTILEKAILAQLPFGAYRCILVRGTSQKITAELADQRIIVHDHLPVNEMEVLLNQSAFVIGRAGYTSLMDYLKLGCRSILIPTPGQAEQAYLAAHAFKNRWAFIVQQQGFSLPAAITAATQFSYASVPASVFRQMKESIVQSLSALQKQPTSVNFGKKTVE